MNNKLQKETVVLSVNWHSPNKNRPDKLDDLDIDADKDSLKLSKEIIRSENFNKTAAVRRRTRAFLKRIALPSPFKNGTYLMPVRCIDDIVDELDKAKTEYEGYADKLVDEYPDIVESAKKRLRGRFNELEFPSCDRLRRGFGMDYQLLEFATPDEGVIGKVAWEKEREKAAAKWKEAEGKVSLALQEGMKKLIDHLVEQLKTSGDGEKKRIHPAAVQKVNDFLEMFGKRNVLDDEKLQKLADTAQAVLKGKDAADLRSSDSIRTEVANKLGKVTKSLSSMITSTKRAFDFDDEE